MQSGNTSLRLEQHDAVLRITLDRPHRRNALDEASVTGLAELLALEAARATGDGKGRDHA